MSLNVKFVEDLNRTIVLYTYITFFYKTVNGTSYFVKINKALNLNIT